MKLKRLVPPPGARVGAALLLAIAMLFGALIVRSFAVTSTDMRLCHVIRRIVAANDPKNVKPGQPGYAYYASHPSEKDAAHEQNLHVLSQLNCEHLPTGG